MDPASPRPDSGPFVGERCWAGWTPCAGRCRWVTGTQNQTRPGWGQSVRWSLTALSDWHTRGLPIPSGRGGWVEVLSAVLKEARRPTSPD